MKWKIKNKRAMTQQEIVAWIVIILVGAVILWWLFGASIQNWIYNLPGYSVPKDDVEIDLTQVKDVEITSDVLSKCVVLAGDVEENYIRINLDQVYSKSITNVKGNLKFRPLKTELILEGVNIIDYLGVNPVLGMPAATYKNKVIYGNFNSNKINVDKNYFNRDYYTKNILFFRDYSPAGNIPSMDQLRFIDGAEVKKIKRADGVEATYICKTEEEFKNYRNGHEKIINDIKQGKSGKINVIFTKGFNDLVDIYWNFIDNRPEVGVWPNGKNFILIDSPEKFVSVKNELLKSMYEEDVNTYLNLLIKSKTPTELTDNIINTIRGGRVSFDKSSVSKIQINNIMYGTDFAEELQ